MYFSAKILTAEQDDGYHTSHSVKCDKSQPHSKSTDHERMMLIQLRKSFIESYRYDYPPHSEFFQEFEFECSSSNSIALSLKQLKDKLQSQLASLYSMEISQISLKMKKEMKGYGNTANNIEKLRKHTFSIKSAISTLIHLQNKSNKSDSNSDSQQSIHSEITHFKFFGFISQKVKSNLLAKGLKINTLHGQIFPTNHFNSRRPATMTPQQTSRIKYYKSGVQNWQFFNAHSFQGSEHFISIDITCKAIYLYSALKEGIILRLKVSFASLKGISIGQNRMIRLNMSEPPQINIFAGERETIRLPKFMEEYEWEQVDVFWLRKASPVVRCWAQRKIWVAIQGQSGQDWVQIIRLATSLKLSISNQAWAIQKQAILEDMPELIKQDDQKEISSNESLQFEQMESFRLTPLGLIRNGKMIMKTFPLIHPSLIKRTLVLLLRKDFSHFLLDFYSELLQNLTISHAKYCIAAWKQEDNHISIFCIEQSCQKQLLGLLPSNYASLKPWSIARILNDTFIPGIPYALHCPQLSLIPSAFGKRHHEFTERVGIIPRQLIDPLIQSTGINAQACVIKFISQEYKGVLVAGEQMAIRKSMIRGRCDESQLLPIRQIAITGWNQYRLGVIDRSCLNLLKTLGLTNDQINSLHTHSQQLLHTLPLPHLLTLVPQDSIFINQEHLKCYSYVQISKLLSTENPEALAQNPDALRQAITQHFISKGNGSIILRKSAKLIAIIDEHETLREDEVFCKMDDGAQSSKSFIPQTEVLLMRPPSFLASHVRRCSSLQEASLSANHPFRQLTNVIVFPCAGHYPLSAQLALGEVGDEYLICWDQEIIKDASQIKKKYIIDAEDKKVDYKQDKSMSEVMLQCFRQRYEFGGPSRIAQWHDMRMRGNPKNLAQDLACRQLAKLYGKSEHFWLNGVSPYLPQDLQPKQVAPPAQPFQSLPKQMQDNPWRIY